MIAKCSWCGGKSVWVSGDKAACNKHFQTLLDEYNQHVIDTKRKEKAKRGDKNH